MLTAARAIHNRPLVVAIGSGLLARMPAVMIGLALVLLVRDEGHPYWAVGIVSGSFVLATGFASPLLGRLADRIGPTPVLVGSTAVSSGALLTLAAVPDLLGIPGLAVLAAVAGASEPPVNAVLRALMPRLASGDNLRVAYSLEAALQEILFIAGPPFVVLIVALASPRSAVVFCAALALAGVAWFTAAVRPYVSTGGPRAPAHALRSLEFRLLLVTFALTGLTLGVIDISTVAGMESHGHRDLAGLALGGWAIGSLIAGVLVARRVRAAPLSRLPWFLLVMAVLTAPLVALQLDPWLLGLGLVLQGTMIAPTLGAIYELVPDLAAPEALTEAFAWTSSFVLAGVAGGAAAGGAIVGTLGVATGFAAATAAAFAGALAARLLARRAPVTN